MNWAVRSGEIAPMPASLCFSFYCIILMEYVRAHAVLSNNGEKKTAVESFTFHKYSSWELSRCIIIKIVRSRCMNHKFSRWIRARKHAFNSCSICALFFGSKTVCFCCDSFVCANFFTRCSASLFVEIPKVWRHSMFDWLWACGIIECWARFSLWGLPY